MNILNLTRYSQYFNDVFCFINIFPNYSDITDYIWVIFSTISKSELTSIFPPTVFLFANKKTEKTSFCENFHPSVTPGLLRCREVDNPSERGMCQVDDSSKERWKGRRLVPPNHPFWLWGFFIINHPFWGTPIFGNTHICIYVYIHASFICFEKSKWGLYLWISMCSRVDEMYFLEV